MHLIEPEGKDWVPFPWCWVSGVRQVDSDLGSAIFSLKGDQLNCAPSLWVLSFTGVQAAWRSAWPLAVRLFSFMELHRQRTHIKVSSQDSEFISKLVGGSSFKQKFAHYFCYFGGCPHNTFYSFISEIFLDLLFYKYVHHNYGLSYESLQSFCCGNIFVNSMPCVLSFLFI